MRRFGPAMLLSLTGIIIVLVLFSAHLQVPTVYALPSFTSSDPTTPSNNTCSGCHSGTAAAGGSVVVNFPTGMTYTPGVTQHLSVTLTDPTHAIWSYLLTARLASSVSSQAGSFTATDANSTVAPNGSIQDIESTNFAVSTWNFDWTPPATSAGNVNFYVIGLAAGSPGGLTSGNGMYQSTFTLTPAVVTPPTLSATPASLNFTYQQGGATPAAQNISVTSSGAALSFTAAAATTTGGTWLSATPASGTTPGTVSASVNPTGLAAGTYTGTVTITSTGATGSPKTINVSLVVSAPPVLSATPTTMSFMYQQGGATPAAQNISVTSSGAALSFTAAAATTTGGTWLSASPTSGTTPGTVSASVNPTGLAAGTYTGTVTITSAGATGSPQTVNVNLVVSAPPVLSATPTTMSFMYQQGGATPAAQNISVTSSGAALSFTAAAATTTGGTWLSASPTSGTTPGTVSASVNPTGLAAGTYTGAVTVTSTGATGSPQTVNVSLVVSAGTGNSLMTVTPSSLEFDYQNGGSVPPPQMLTITSTGSPLSYTASSSDVSWLTASPTGGNTPATTMVAVNPVGMSPGSYSGLIQVSAPGTTASIVPVTLNVTQNLSNTTTSSSSYPAITVDANSAINIAWQDSTSGILFSRSVNGGTTFSTPKPIPGSVGALFQPQMIVDGNNSIDIVWTGAGATEVLFSRSTDGINFSATPKIVAQNLGGVLNSAPRIGLDSNGGTDIVWGRTDEYFSRSTDAGATFSTPVKLSTAVGNISASRITASSTGNLYVVWTDEQNRTTTGNCNEFLSRSLDQGVTFSTPAAIYSGGCSHDNMQTAVDSSGTILFFWSDDIPVQDVLFSRSIDFGSTFMSPINLAKSAANSLQGAIDTRSGYIDVVWAGDPSVAGGIFFSRSVDDGATFASQKLLSVPGPAGTLPPASPQILVDASGNINVIWQQGTAGTNTFDVFFTRSTDGGVTFQTVQKVSASSSLQCAPTAPCGNARFALDAVGDSDIVWVDHAVNAQNSNIDFSRVVLSQPISDFAIGISPASQNVVPGGTVSYTLTLTTTGGFNQAVALSCSGLPVGVTCAAPIPAAITPPGSATLNVTVANTVAPGTYSFIISGAGGGTTHNDPVKVQVVPESLTLSTSSGSASIAAGSSANFTMTAASTSGVTGAVTLSCTGAPSGVGCAFAPVQVTVPANGNATTTLTVNVTSKPAVGPFHKFPREPLPLRRIMLWWLIVALLLVSRGILASSRRRYATVPFLARGVAIMSLTIILSAGLISCSGFIGTSKTSTSTPPVSFTLTIQAQNQSGSVKATIPLQITVP